MLYSHHPEPPQVTKQAKSWRDVLKVHPAADLFPRMAADELKALGEDIRQRGLTSPIAITASRYVSGDWQYQLLDDINRLDGMERADITLVLKDGQCIIESELDCAKGGRFFPPAIVVKTDLVAYVISANVHRRHLTTQQKLALLDKAMKAHPSISSRRVAKLVGVSPTTATKSRRKLEAKGDVSTVDTSIDTRGRKQPTRKPPARKSRRDVDDYLAEKKARLAATQAIAAPAPAPQPFTPEPTDLVTPSRQMQVLAEELVQFTGDYCARVKHWAKAPGNQHIATLARILEQVSAQLQTLAQEIEGRNPDADDDGIPAFLRRVRDEVPSTVDSQETVS